jgi:hypothetical protein
MAIVSQVLSPIRRVQAQGLKEIGPLHNLVVPALSRRMLLGQRYLEARAAASTIVAEGMLHFAKMSTDTEVHMRGLHALVQTLGPVDAERFITLILREPFDYTQWQRPQFYPPLRPPAQLRIQQVAQGIAQHVKTKDRQTQRHPREDRHPRRLQHICPARTAEHPAPRWGWRGYPKA